MFMTFFSPAAPGTEKRGTLYHFAALHGIILQRKSAEWNGVPGSPASARQIPAGGIAPVSKPAVPVSAENVGGTVGTVASGHAIIS